MIQKLTKIKDIIRQIKEKSEPISGGSGEKERFQMQEPMLYWKLGETIQELCEEKKIALKDRKGWVKKHLWEIDNEIWPDHPQSYHGYRYVHELVDKDLFLIVINLAGHKFKKFRRKRVDYLLSAFSKYNPTATKKQQEELIKRLEEKDYSHNEFYKIKTEVLGKSKIPVDEIKDLFDQLFNDVVKAHNNFEYRKILRKELGSQLITQLSYVLQLLKMTNDKLKLEKAFTKKIKNDLHKESKSNSKIGVQLFKYLRKCLDEPESTKILLQTIDISEINELTTNLFAIESEVNFEEYTKSTKALEEIFKD